MSQITPSELLLSGCALITMPLGQKGPTHQNWNTSENATRHPTTKNFHNVNIGLAHAYCSPSPTGAVDVDNYEHAKSWLASHGIELDVLLRAKDSVVIHSGKKFSLKLLYRLPLDYKPLESKKINGPDCKSALEFRCATKDGKTVQDVLPPSIHPDGHQYVWIGNGNPLQMPEIPNELLEIWEQLIRNGSRVALRKPNSVAPKNGIQETPRQIATIAEALSFISSDCNYETWRNVVWAILSLGWLCAEDIAYEWSKTAANRFEEDAFWLVANSYIPDLTGGITVGTIYHHARLGGWNG